MKAKTSLYTLIFLFVIALFITRPGESSHREIITKHLALREPSRADEHEEFILKNVRYVDGWVISWAYIDSVKVSTGIIGRITVHDGDIQRKALNYKPITYLK